MLASNGQGYDNGQPYKATDKFAVESDETGHFEITNVATGYARLTVAAEGYYSDNGSPFYDVPSDNITLRLSRAGGIQGRVTDPSGKALSSRGGQSLMVFLDATELPKEATHIYRGGAGAVTVKADGTFEFNNVPPGDYRLTCGTNPSRGHPNPPPQIITVKPGAPVIVKLVYE
jgi:hypothetical protein